MGEVWLAALMGHPIQRLLLRHRHAGSKVIQTIVREGIRVDLVLDALLVSVGIPHADEPIVSKLNLDVCGLF